MQQADRCPPPPPGPLLTGADEIALAVVGAHLTGMPLNHQLTDRGARLLRTTLTAPVYRLYALQASTQARPGLVRVPDGQGAGIEVEIWAMPVEQLGSLVAAVPAPLSIGRLALADGGEVTGFLCEAHAVEAAQDITHAGGWRAHVAATACRT